MSAYCCIKLDLFINEVLCCYNMDTVDIGIRRQQIKRFYTHCGGARGSAVGLRALRYKPESRGFDSDLVT